MTGNLVRSATRAIAVAMTIGTLATVVAQEPSRTVPRPDVARASSGRTASEPDLLASANERYAAAEYEEALTLLGQVKPAASDIATRTEIERCRALCFLALAREKEAQQAMESLFTIDPSYNADRLEVSPKIRNMFHEVRQRVLPAIIRDEYASGKAAFDRKSYQEATAHLQRALTLLDDADAGTDASLRDIATLAQGFVDLSRAASAPVAQAATSGNRTPAVQTPATTARRPPKIVDAVPIQQSFPQVSRQLRQMADGREGIIELSVDETGRVRQAVMRKQIHPVYDELLVKAALNWRYRPETVDNKPVPQVVTVVVKVQ